MAYDEEVPRTTKQFGPDSKKSVLSTSYNNWEKRLEQGADEFNRYTENQSDRAGTYPRRGRGKEDRV
jgi:hypothetical protein